MNQHQHHNTSITTLNMDMALRDHQKNVLSLGNDLVILEDFTWNDLYSMPLQLGFLMICLCTEGEAKFMLGEKEQELKKGELFISFGQQIFSKGSVSDDFQAKAVLMSRSYAQDCIVGLNYMWPYLLYLMKDPVVKLSLEEQLWIIDCYELIRNRLSKPAGRYIREAVAALVRAFYFEVCNLLDCHIQPDRTVTQNRSYAIFDKFIRLVSAHYCHERSVEWYSSEMCLTPKHLSEVVKLVSGKTAGQWISSLVMTEIKTLLQDSTLTIKEIAQRLNFPSQSFLGKYFKNIEGISPTDYRKGIE